jgi:hypothetical protein
MPAIDYVDDALRRAGMRSEPAAAQMNASDTQPEPPRPLMRELPPADPFPVEALGDVLKLAARAVHDRVQAPVAMCGQSVLAAATLAVQAHADVELPTGKTRPLTNFFASVAETGERKSAVDEEALWAVRKREATLRERYDAERLTYENDKLAWEKARDTAIKDKKVRGDRARIKEALDALGPSPVPPLEPILTSGEPTYEGLCKLLALGWPSVGIFSDEGGQFIGGHGMTDEAKLRTAAGLSHLWDGKPIKRVRATDGLMILPGRRVAMHLMAQPDVMAMMLGDHLLTAQGLLSRFLVTAPDAAGGTRMWREPLPDSDAALKRYDARLLDILELSLPLATGKHNELTPRTLPLSVAARRIWIGFHDHIEKRISRGEELDPIRGLANKLPEHAARIAAVLTLTRDIEACDVAIAEMEAGILLAQHYAAEALRLFGASRVSADLHRAQQLLAWLHGRDKRVVSLPDIYQAGPNAIRDKATAAKLVAILEDHGHLVRLPDGAEINGKRRRDAWRLLCEE